VNDPLPVTVSGVEYVPVPLYVTLYVTLVARAEMAANANRKTGNVKAIMRDLDR
jgi:hypothetical protein